MSFESPGRTPAGLGDRPDSVDRRHLLVIAAGGRRERHRAHALVCVRPDGSEVPAVGVWGAARTSRHRVLRGPRSTALWR